MRKIASYYLSRWRICLLSVLMRTALLVCSTSCTSDKDEDLLIDCVSKLQKFHFIGINTNDHPEYNLYSVPQSSVKLDLREDQKFTLQISFTCETAPPNLCDPTSLKSGIKTYELKGTWTYEQEFYVSSFKNTREKKIKGTCTLEIEESSDSTYLNTSIKGKYYVECSTSFIDFRMPMYRPDSLFFQFIR